VDAKEIKMFAVNVLKELIRIPSFSREERKAADFFEALLKDQGWTVQRKNNNIWIRKIFDDQLPTLLLNSHLDTVKPGDSWTYDPFEPVDENGKIYGLGSNDAGASLVTLLAVFILLSEQKECPYNLIYAATAEEEISGQNGVESILEDLGKVDLGIVGEPTGMNLAIAEKGLLVLDCLAHGKRSHAAVNNGINAIYQAMLDIEWIRNYSFIKKSGLLGEVTMQVTQISGGESHNIVPDQCLFVVDVRTNDCYSNKEIFEIICQNLSSDSKYRSLRLNPSAISPNHPVVKKAEELGINCVGSLTLSDQALMTFPTVKIGPGDSARSHTADEYIMVSEITDGIEIFMRLLNNLKLI
jgi:acetylornithine deacetylase